ncbi:putative mitochondrial import inner membrane translocase subunit TIM23 [Endogone sp. FLAS-F59071]|nr:putative mitochondrial import inner membrane translocase subunit TIM23 [Endogone sp. FLAS-F59071]|eukprot:RUS21619.1 putative mitochondrial import inner membrane translocase subunit TIM23 [Endogone sp. FLAS-F59071]
MSFTPDSSADRQSNHQNTNGFEPNKVSDFLNDVTFDPVRLHPMAGQGGIDFLQVDDYSSAPLPGTGHTALPSRGWSDDLCYGTGTTYLAGLTLGGAWGLAEGVRKGSTAPNFKIRVNGILNSVTRRGPFIGNSVGVVAMLYNGTNSIIGHYRGKHDTLNSAAAGAISGALFKSTAGVRAAGSTAAVGAVLACTWSLCKEYILS